MLPMAKLLTGLINRKDLSYSVIFGLDNSGLCCYLNFYARIFLPYASLTEYNSSAATHHDFPCALLVINGRHSFHASSSMERLQHSLKQDGIA
jgi:hypothetical protein